ncbi:DNA polymerase-3 subunit alpha [Parabacteroides sp. PF5-5]|uniref:DNA polymerase III subunit alpha n=1 Tax=unclassified Parabacteroides TaxID=2649774 RepID=UPI0024747B8A|nr:MULTISPECIES: DNA polymerase III subunit alpha [unclassified Parabacteroides]MDH6306801.1 DNA polymerase-3 subunit alpha [Parabacteroides sp. PH5-39]MDH6317687.1 DNA polymerase-3 subunit alpha [Parabacteroides sp. PF5-13]MDH6321513.1 DNA polymerase-3 subunit alpha [Parabacteroides sp. PH5-13]MDH6325210.1 DNA polymerase-3 subunit alpha [Parabacteroides sp. PH5-8]MDH6328872.1 DNA polymerase-3 subunit alpha [Parabacteroides sp. PH5-41]
MEPFIHLHVHTQYSLLDGQASIDALIEKAQKDGMRGIAMTDHGNMFGIKEFYNKVKKKNSKYFATIKDCEKELNELNNKSNPTEEEVGRMSKLSDKIEESKKALFKPILGCECYCARNGRASKSGKEDLSGYHLIVLAKSLKGYKNLIKMVSTAWTEGFYGRPRIDKELLEKYHEDLIICSACLGGEIPQHIMKDQIGKAEEAIQWFKNLFGEDYYLELQRHQTNNPNADQSTFPKQQEVNKVLIELAHKHNVKIIASNDVHFVNEEDAEAHDRLICLSTGKDLDDPSRMRYSKQEWMKTTAEMNAIFADIPEALHNTLEILDKVEYYSIDNDPLMPDFPIPEGFENADEYLRHLTYEGAKKKYDLPLSDEVTERIDFELKTIKNMGFPGYFLIVQDFIAAAREMGVSVGPGRGSAAGSAVAYCLGITDIDPIKYDLLFERFLNPDRISMPDIDVDFDDDGRGKVLDWVTKKYGKEKVAHIITYGTMATKSAIKDVARVQKLPLSESNRLAKLVPDRIPDVKKINLKAAINYVPELKDAAESTDVLTRETLKYAQMLEGNVRNTGVHACGVIIGQSDISDVVPISTAKDKETGEEMLVTQYEGSVIEETGLIKMDFLGLKTLSIIKDAVENVYQTTGEKIDIDHVSLEDQITFDLYCQGKTTGTFQFESAGMQKYLKELQPSKFEDLIAMNALYRPGPMDYIPSFIARKHGREEIKYDLPVMERYLKDTYGITVYQEQVMLLSRLLADFTRGESDALRKAMGKKLIDKMNELKEKFLTGGKKNGYEEKTLNKIWADWEKFASYAFNKSHATCYSWVAYQTAYLKAHYPSEYMAAVLSRSLSNITEITKFMDECKAMGIQVLGPDVNESVLKFNVNTAGDIRFGLGAVKGVGESAVMNIIEERKNGPFKDIFDFVERINLTACNKKNIEALALSGAFDNFGVQREQFFTDNGKGEIFLETLVRYGNKYQTDKSTATNSLFGDDSFASIAKPEIPKCMRWSDLERLNREKELVGIYLSAHPLDEYKIILTYACNTGVAELNDRESLQGREIVMGGIVTECREGTTKKGSPYGVMKIEDFTGSSEIALFGNTYVDFSKYFRVGMYLLINAKVEPHKWKAGELDLHITSMRLLQDVKDSLIEKIRIIVPIHELNESMIHELSTLIKTNPGQSLLYFKVVDGEENVVLNFFSQNVRLNVTSELIDFLQENENIDFKIN